MKAAHRILIVGTIIGLALLLGAVLGGVFAPPARVAHGPQPSPTPEVLGNGWYRFTDKDAGYSISYPPDAYLDAQNEAGLEFKQARIGFPMSVSDANQGMLITVYSNNEGASLTQIVQQRIYQGTLPQNSNGILLTPVKIAGLDAARMEMMPSSPAVLISAKGRVYILSLPTNTLWGNPPTQASVDLFYQIVNTFSLN